MTKPLPQDVVVLCGGLGTRLRPVVNDRPKSMALIDGIPFLDILLDHIVGQGARRIILCVGYLAQAIVAHRGRTDCTVVVSQEDSPLGTAGAIRQALPLIEGESFLVVNGDSYCPASYPALIAAHDRVRPLATVAVVESDGSREGGIITLEPTSRVRRFEEKPGQGIRGWFNAGLYAFERQAFAGVPAGQPASLETDVLPRLWPRLYGWVVDQPLYDIGTPAGLRAFEVYQRRRMSHAGDGEAAAGDVRPASDRG